MNRFSALRELARRLVRRQTFVPSFQPSLMWRALEQRLQKVTRVVDLGCGSTPHPKATVGVDVFMEPVERTCGHGSHLSAATFKHRAIKFVQASLEVLPFADGAFEFAYSHHVFEHLRDPKKACAEICRIAQAGVIITPSVFSEIAFGRPYHRWLVQARGNTLLFVQKTAPEDRPFGDHPLPAGEGQWRAVERTNPFEILLDDGHWYHGREGMPRLARLLRQY